MVSFSVWKYTKSREAPVLVVLLYLVMCRKSIFSSVLKLIFEIYFLIYVYVKCIFLLCGKKMTLILGMMCIFHFCESLILGILWLCI